MIVLIESNEILVDVWFLSIVFRSRVLTKRITHWPPLNALPGFCAVVLLCWVVRESFAFRLVACLSARKTLSISRVGHHPGYVVNSLVSSSVNKVH